MNKKFIWLIAIIIILISAGIYFAYVIPQLSDEQLVRLLALADAVMERRTGALVSPISPPLMMLRHEWALESPELFQRERSLIAQLVERRKELYKQGETYVRSETRLVPVRVRVWQNTATIVVLEQSKLYYAVVAPGQPEYMAWEAKRSFVFVRPGAVWELIEHGLMEDKVLPPNEPGRN